MDDTSPQTKATDGGPAQKRDPIPSRRRKDAATAKRDRTLCVRGWNLTRRVFGDTYLLRLLGAYLNTEALACLYIALPRDWRDLLFDRGNLVAWGKRHDRGGGECLLRLDSRSTLLDMGSYLSFRHLQEHTRWDGEWVYDDESLLYAEHNEHLEAGGMNAVDPSVSYRAIQTAHFFRPHPIDDIGRRFLAVRACLFLPVKGPPPPFAGNLVVLGVGGHLVFYAPTLDGFEVTCAIELDCNPHGLACSPRGTALLAAHEDAVFVSLQPGIARCIRTGVSVGDASFLGSCFTSENAFLTTDQERRVWHHRLEDGTAPPGGKVRGGGKRRKKCASLRQNRASATVKGVTRQSVVWADAPSPNPKARPPRHTLGRDAQLALCYKPRTPDTPDCLLLAHMRHRQGLGPCLVLHLAPRAPEETRLCITFHRALVASLAVHPGHERVYVLVVTRLKRDEFFRRAWAPLCKRSEESCLPFGNSFDRDVTGVVAVYELLFAKRELSEVVPRFFLDAVPLSLPAYELHPHRPLPPTDRETRRRMYAPHPEGDLAYFGAAPEMQLNVSCGLTHLVVALDQKTLAHLTLFATAESTVACQRLKTPFKTFAFSEHHSFGVVFGCGAGRRHHAPLMSCPKYNRFFPDVIREKIKEKAAVQQGRAVALTVDASASF